MCKKLWEPNDGGWEQLLIINQRPNLHQLEYSLHSRHGWSLGMSQKQ